MPPLWEPSRERVEAAHITRFISLVNEKFSLNVGGYADLYQWSIDNREDFWASVWEFGEVIASKPYEKVLEDSPSMMGAKWFVGSELNFAENLLRFRDDRDALVFKGESEPAVRMTYAELYDNVARLAKALRDAGVGTGDRVAGFVPNMYGGPSSRCSQRPALEPSGLRVPPTSASRGYSTGSVRSSPRSCSLQTDTTTTARLSIPCRRSAVFSKSFPVSRRWWLFHTPKKEPTSAPCPTGFITGISCRRKRAFRFSSSSSPLPIRSTSCIHPAQQACPSVWFTVRAERSSSISRSTCSMWI